jgi:hypothetical protein
MTDTIPVSLNVKVTRMAQAIAKAEGFGPPNNLPTRINNPGDLELGDQGNGVDQEKTIFKTEQDGWDALEGQVRWMLTGNSHVYSLTDTILQVAERYTGYDDADAWASIVARELGITISTTLAGYLTS